MRDAQLGESVLGRVSGSIDALADNADDAGVGGEYGKEVHAPGKQFV